MLTQLLPLAKEKSSPRLANSAALHVSPTPRAQERKDPRKNKKEKKQDREGGRKAEGGTEGGREGGKDSATRDRVKALKSNSPQSVKSLIS